MASTVFLIFLFAFCQAQIEDSDKDLAILLEEIFGKASPDNVSKSGCGWSKSQVVSDSNLAVFTDFPWMVAILKVVPKNPKKPEEGKEYLYTSGGSVLHPRVVLTTAHNIFEKNIKLLARAGEYDTESQNEEIPHQDRNVERVIIHEQFNTVRVNLFNDVALLVLDKDLEFAANVNSICLPPVGKRAVNGIRCFSAGWGKTNFGTAGSYQSVLKKVNIPVVDRDRCQRELRRTRLGPLFKLHNTFMCAGGEKNKDTCTGDGGSPLMCPIDGQEGRYAASGMVAWGVGCGDAVPAVYADVAVLRPWIDTKMAELGFGQDSYTY